MATQQQSRSLEVVVLAGRGLSGEIPAGARRKVQLTLVSTRDPEGEAFSAKVSPWTVAKERGQSLRFGSAGLKCSFPLSLGRGAPDLVTDVRFTEGAALRVRLLASMVSTNSYVSRTAAELLPSALTNMATKELDEATAQLEGEVRVPLTNILSGRVGKAADRALGGWVPLRRCFPEEDCMEMGIDGLPPALWMQMYALPDHQAMLPALQAHLAEMVTGQPGAGQLPAPVQSAGRSAAPKPAAEAQRAAPRWGPKAAQAQGAGQQSGTLEDLIDVGLDDAQETTLLPDLSSSDLLDVDLDSNAGLGMAAQANNLPVVEQGLPRTGGLLDGLSPASQAQNFEQGLPRAGGLLAGLSPAPQAQNSIPTLGGTSAFSFTQAGNSGGNDSAGGASGSAFGFIAGSSGGGQLDLAALYASSDQAPKTQQVRDYSALWSYTDATQCSGPSAGTKSTPVNNSLESLEQNMLANLGSDLKL